MVRELLRGLVDGVNAVRLRRFFLVGLFASGVQTVLLWLLAEPGGLHRLVAATLAIECTILLQFFLNNAWTFRESRRTGTRELAAGLVRTNLVRGTAIPIQLVALEAFVTLGGLPLVVANGGAIAVSGVYRYALDTRWTWG